MKEDIFLKNSIGLLILAGGKSQRMGRDKGTLKIGEHKKILLSGFGGGLAWGSITITL